MRQGQRADQPAAARLRPEPDLVRPRRPRRRPRGLDADPRPHRPCRPAVGTQEPAPAAALHRRPPPPPPPPPPRPPAGGPGCTWPNPPHSSASPSPASTDSTPWPPQAEHGDTVPTTAAPPGPVEPGDHPDDTGPSVTP